MSKKYWSQFVLCSGCRESPHDFISLLLVRKSPDTDGVDRPFSSTSNSSSLALGVTFIRRYCSSRFLFQNMVPITGKMSEDPFPKPKNGEVGTVDVTLQPRRSISCFSLSKLLLHSTCMTKGGLIVMNSAALEMMPRNVVLSGRQAVRWLGNYLGPISHPTYRFLLAGNRIGHILYL